MPSPDQNQTARSYLDRSLDELFAELESYEELPSVIMRGGGATRGLGSLWSSVEPRLRQKVCVEWNWCARRENYTFQNQEALVVALAEMMTNRFMPQNVPVVLLASIAVKLGLDKFCACRPVPSAAEGAA